MDHHTIMNGTSTTAIAAVERGALGGDVRTELESELRGLAMAARMHGYFIALTHDGKPTIVAVPGGKS